MANPWGDLGYLNGPPVVDLAGWADALPGEVAAMEAKLRSISRGDDFVTIPFPRLAAGPGGESEAARALAEYRREAAVVDARLVRKVSLTLKGTALSDVCDRLRTDTGIQLTAGRSVADEKVTLFCKAMPLRDVMRQLSRPFGYTWLRSGGSPNPPTLGGERVGRAPVLGGEPAGYRYELAQDLRSQLVEEELRGRDRNAALLALDREMGPYRPYLHLSPDEARARMATAPPEERKVLARLAGAGWGPIQMYFRLSPQDLAALRAGQGVTFSAEPGAHPAGRGSSQQPLPPELARGVLQSIRDRRLRVREDRIQNGMAEDLPDGLPLASVPEARAMVHLRIRQSELGQFTLDAGPGFFTVGSRPGPYIFMGPDDSLARGPLAVGVSPFVQDPRNAAANAKLARDPGLQRRVGLRPVGSRQSAVGREGSNGTDERPTTNDH